MQLRRQLFALPPACLLLLFGLGASASQRVQYSYDAAGNRVLRKAAMPAFAQPQIKSFGSAAQDAAAAQPNMLEASPPKAKSTVYPNPTSGLLVVNIAGGDPLTEVQVLLYSISGALVRQWPATAGSSTLDISEQPPGVYIVRIDKGDGQPESWRIVKK